MNFARDSRRAGPATIVALLNRPLLAALWPPLLVMALLTAALALRHYLAGAAAAGAAVAQAPAVLKNPFSLGAAIRHLAGRRCHGLGLLVSCTRARCSCERFRIARSAPAPCTAPAPW